MSNIHKVIPGDADFDIWHIDPFGFCSDISWDDVPEEVQDNILQYAHEYGEFQVLGLDNDRYEINIYPQS